MLYVCVCVCGRGGGNDNNSLICLFTQPTMSTQVYAHYLQSEYVYGVSPLAPSVAGDIPQLVLKENSGTLCTGSNVYINVYLH